VRCSLEVTMMGSGAGEEPLKQGFRTAAVTRIGGVVRRSAGSWSPAVHGWLTHLAEVGVELAPRPVALDLDAGIEELTYLPGVVPSGGASPEYLWSDDTLAATAQMVRRFHDAAGSFVPPARAAWQETMAFPGGGDVICHNDLAPWNTVFVGQRPTAFIDWDEAATGPRAWDVVYALWHFVPLYGDPATDPFGLGQFEPRARRCRLFCDAYGLGPRDRAGLVNRIVLRQRTVYRAMSEGARAGEPAYVRLWEMGAGAGIQRQIEYVNVHRPELEDALA
jgi:hypothetical protein